MAAPEISGKSEAFASAAETAASECLSDEEVLAFAGGTLESARHLEAHLHFDQCEICQRLLSEAAHALATAVTAPFLEQDGLSWHTTFQPGTLVGNRYLIVRFIARGGMGEVYEAFDRELQERVALKTVTSTACDNANAVRRLKAEVQLARRVSHPNVCRIYDFGTHAMPETGAQISFLTMEFVEGETLGQRIRLAGALPIDQARALGRNLLRGLCAAHEAGVLHRDFKSDNVMLRAEPTGVCSPLILDFGLARALDDGSRTSSGSHPSLLGTFGYIAPEQLEGRPHTTASDVYSFGIVWFEMLTGELPFESPSSPISGALARLQRPAAPPSSKNPLVPSDLDTIILGCLRRSPTDRFRTAREVLATLEALEARAQRSFQKRKIMPLAAAAVLGAIAAYVAIIPSGSQPLDQVTLHANLAAAQVPRAELPVAAPNPPLAEALPARDAVPGFSVASAAPPENPVHSARRALRPRPTLNQPLPTDRVDSPSPPVSEVPQAEPSVTKPPLPPWEDPFGVVSPSPQAGGRGP